MSPDPSDNDFSAELISSIEKTVSENAATPAVIRDSLNEIASKREQELNHYKVLLKELSYFNFEPDENEFDEGQVGFKIPRELFDNNFGGLISELNFIRKFVRLVAEAEGENPEQIEVGSISTTDPVFWLLVAFGVAKTIGHVTTWSLDSWKKVEEIRNIRAQTARISAFDAAEVEAMFGPKIEQQISAAIEEKVEELTANVEDQGRKNELKNGLRPALRQFLARVERGLTVDVRYLPSNDTEEGDGINSAEDIELKRAEIQTVASTLLFPEPVGEPVLQLEAANDDRPAAKPSKPKP